MNARAGVCFLLLGSLTACGHIPAPAASGKASAQGSGSATSETPTANPVQVIANARYGYSVEIPGGWEELHGRQLMVTTRDLTLVPIETNTNSPAIEVRVCRAPGYCHQSYPWDVTKRATGPLAELGGFPAQEVILTEQTVTATRVWHVYHVGASRYGYTYDVVLTLPMGQLTPPSAFSAVVQSWKWVGAPKAVTEGVAAG